MTIKEQGFEVAFYSYLRLVDSESGGAEKPGQYQRTE